MSVASVASVSTSANYGTACSNCAQCMFCVSGIVTRIEVLRIANNAGQQKLNASAVLAMARLADRVRG